MKEIVSNDSGSTVLGLALAFLGLHFSQPQGTEVRVAMFSVVAAALPLLDAALAVVRRIRRFRSPFKGDRLHFYDLLLARGWPPRKVALACYTITLILAADGCAALRAHSLIFNSLATAGIAALLALALRLGSVRHQKEDCEAGLPLGSSRAV